MEKITVIVPVYNVDPFLERALKSLTEQTYTNLQILLIDDGSTDKSGEICEEWSKKDEYSVYIRKIPVYPLQEIMVWIWQRAVILCLWMRMTGLSRK